MSRLRRRSPATPELIETGQARLRAILALIDGAQHSLKLLFYMFNADRAGERVRDALVDAARRGVEVKLLIDGFGSAAPPDFFTVLSESGGDIACSTPPMGAAICFATTRSSPLPTSRIAIIGGANIDDSYLTDRGAAHWRDLWLRITGPKAKPAAIISIRCSAGPHARARGCARCGGWSPNIASGAARCSGSSPVR